MILEEEYLVKYLYTKQGTFWYERKPNGEKKRRYFTREQSHYVANDMRK